MTSPPLCKVSFSFDADVHSWFPCLTSGDIPLFIPSTSGLALEKMHVKRDACFGYFPFSSGKIESCVD